MARLPFITGGMFLLMGAVSFAPAQAARPGMPGQIPTQPPVTAPQVGRPQFPSTNGNVPGASQPQQPVSRPADSSTGPLVPPVVTYRDGLLTVQALNSNLGSVVKAIRSKAGIEFEGAENISEPVAISLGPAPAADVLAAMFAGSRYDFVALGRPDSPSIVQRVILTVKNKPGAPGTPAEAQAQSRPGQQGEGDEEETPDEQVNGGDPQDTPVQPPQVPQQPPQPENQPQPKTPEQILQELQQMQNQKAPPDPQNPSTAPRKVPPRSF